VVDSDLEPESEAEGSEDDKKVYSQGLISRLQIARLNLVESPCIAAPDSDILNETAVQENRRVNTVGSVGGIADPGILCHQGEGQEEGRI